MPRRAKICQSNFMFWPTLSHAAVFQQRLDGCERVLLRNLVRRKLRFRREQVAAALLAASGGRSARSRPRCGDREREAAQLRRASDRCWWSGCRSRPSRGPWRAATQAFSRSSVRTISYFERSNLPSRAASMRGRELRRGVCSVVARPGGLRCSLPRLRAEGWSERAHRPRSPFSGSGEAADRDAVARRQLRIRLDLARLDAGLLRDAPRQRGELHRLEERDEPLVVRLVHREVVDRHVERDVLIERDEPPRDPRLLGVVDQRLAPLLLLDLAGARRAAFRGRRIRSMSCAAVLTPMPGTPGTLSVESPISACTSITFSGGTPNFSITSAMPMRLVLHGVVHDHAVAHELHQVLVGRHDGGGRLGLAGEPRIGRDQVVGLEAGLLQARNVERAAPPRGSAGTAE